MSDQPECDELPPRNRLLCRGEITVGEFLGLGPDWKVSQPSRGMGDTVAKLTHATGLAYVAKAVLRRFCGCESRQAWLNRKWPYSRKES